MKKIKICFLLFSLAIFVAGCGSGREMSKEAARALKSYDSYAYLPSGDTIKNRDFNNNEVNEIIVEIINENMRDEGYSIDRNQPDVLIHVHTMFDERADVDANPIYTSYSYYRPGLYIGPYVEPYVYDNYFTIQRLSGEVKQVPYRERTVVIDFIDRRSKEILWRGTAPEQIETRRLEREIRDHIEDIFKKFP